MNKNKFLEILSFFKHGWFQLLLSIPIAVLYLDQHKPRQIYNDAHPIWVAALNNAVFPSLITLAAAQLYQAWDKYQNGKHKEQMAKLENSLQGNKEAHKRILEEHLTLICNKCNFGKTERISVYIFTQEGFRLVGRHSDNYLFKTRGRGGYYPSDKGIIASAWNQGQVKSPDLPDPSIDLDTWVDSLQILYKTPPETLRNLNMKSRFYYAHRISNGSKWLGVIVLESQKKTKISQSNINYVVTNHLPQLASILDNLDIESVTLEYARSEGF